MFCSVSFMARRAPPRNPHRRNGGFKTLETPNHARLPDSGFQSLGGTNAGGFEAFPCRHASSFSRTSGGGGEPPGGSGAGKIGGGPSCEHRVTSGFPASSVVCTMPRSSHQEHARIAARRACLAWVFWSWNQRRAWAQAPQGGTWSRGSPACSRHRGSSGVDQSAGVSPVTFGVVGFGGGGGASASAGSPSEKSWGGFTCACSASNLLPTSTPI